LYEMVKGSIVRIEGDIRRDSEEIRMELEL
jgi:hypothetical protein